MCIKHSHHVDTHVHFYRAAPVAASTYYMVRSTSFAREPTVSRWLTHEDALRLALCIRAKGRTAIIEPAY